MDENEGKAPYLELWEDLWGVLALLFRQQLLEPAALVSKCLVLVFDRVELERRGSARSRSRTPGACAFWEPWYRLNTLSSAHSCHRITAPVTRARAPPRHHIADTPQSRCMQGKCNPAHCSHLCRQHIL